MSLDHAFAHCPNFYAAASLKESEPCLSSIVAEHPLRTAKSH